jgi:hypothetical protein
MPRVRLEALKVRYDVWCEGDHAAELAAAVAAAWDWSLVDDDGDAPAHRTLRVRWDDAAEAPAEASGPAMLAGSDLPSLMDRLTPMLTWLALTERRDDLVMFHACAVADPETGHAVALYGPSGTGKTTLARTLCTDLVYLSDETAAVDADLDVVAYPKPLSLLPASGAGLKDQVSPGALGLLRATDRRYPLRGLLQLRRDPAHAGPPTVEPLAVVDALPELVAQTSYTRDMERPLHRLADLVRRTGGARRVTYAESETLRPVVRAVLDGEA